MKGIFLQSFSKFLERKQTFRFIAGIKDSVALRCPATICLRKIIIEHLMQGLIMFVFHIYFETTNAKLSLFCQ